MTYTWLIPRVRGVAVSHSGFVTLNANKSISRSVHHETACLANVMRHAKHEYASMKHSYIFFVLVIDVVGVGVCASFLLVQACVH